MATGAGLRRSGGRHQARSGSDSLRRVASHRRRRACGVGDQPRGARGMRSVAGPGTDGAARLGSVTRAGLSRAWTAGRPGGRSASTAATKTASLGRRALGGGRAWGVQAPLGRRSGARPWGGCCWHRHRGRHRAEGRSEAQRESQGLGVGPVRHSGAVSGRPSGLAGRVSRAVESVSPASSPCPPIAGSASAAATTMLWASVIASRASSGVNYSAGIVSGSASG